MPSAKRERDEKRDLRDKIPYSREGHKVSSIGAVGTASEAISQTFIRPNAIVSDWEPSPRPRKRIRRTYSSRELEHSLCERPAKHEASSFTTTLPKFSAEPLIQNLSYDFKADQLCSSSLQQKMIERPVPTKVESSEPISIVSTDSRLGDSLRRFAKSKYPDRWQLIEGIQNGLETLLKVTTKPELIPRLGARSLFSTCLKSVPHYIFLEESRCKMEDPENKVDVSLAIYDELEAYGASPHGGWKSLKEVVKAHGISMIGSVVKDGLIELPIASYLVKICLHRGAFDEAQHIVECMIVVLKGLSKTARFQDRILVFCLSILDQFVALSGRFGFQYRQLESMLRNGTLSIGWILSDDMIECWSRVMRSVADGDSSSRDAGNLVQTVALISLGASDTDISSHIQSLRVKSRNMHNIVLGKSTSSAENGSNHLLPEYPRVEDLEIATQAINSDLLAAVCSIDILQNSAPRTKLKGLSTARLPAFQNIVLQACRFLEVGNFYTGFKRNQLCMDRICLPLLAAGVSSASAGVGDSELSYYLDIIQKTNISRDFPESAASLLCTVAHCCNRATSGNGVQHMQKMVEKLVTLYTSGDCEPKIRLLLGNIAASAAIRYSHSTSIPKHLSWALEVESLVNRIKVGLDSQSPSKICGTSLTRTKHGFRWEEGICEWVAGTPGIPAPKYIVHKDQDSRSPGPGSSPGPPLVVRQTDSLDTPKSLVLASMSSPKLNSKADSLEAKPNIVGNRSCGIFLHVEIENIRRAHVQPPEKDSHIKPGVLTRSQSVEQRCAIAVSNKSCSLELLQKRPDVKISGLAPNTGHQKSIYHDRKKKKVKAPLLWDNTCDQNICRPGTEPQMDTNAESADELSLS